MTSEGLTLIDQINELENLFLESLRVPFTSQRLVNEQEATLLFEQIRTSVPSQIIEAEGIISSKEELLSNATEKSEKLLRDACLTRNKILNSSSINKLAIKQANEIRKKSQHAANLILLRTKKKKTELEEELIKSQKILQKKFKLILGRLEHNLLQKKALMIKDYQHQQTKLSAEIEKLKKQRKLIISLTKKESRKLVRSSTRYGHDIITEGINIQKTNLDKTRGSLYG
ncbi:hypothetical protein [Prochlorococcus sp. MIT 1341]|uniref:hypothetical protein n=1 Tax=Prochlorococcus sp. MIT 1341 TaxID=3096221 RepID=UPI002A7621FA|nr:hypothetical protein [Prochlorococcus sp. MIT 1341]